MDGSEAPRNLEFEKMQVDKLHDTLLKTGEGIDGALSVLLSLLAATFVIAFAIPNGANAEQLIDVPIVGLKLHRNAASLALAVLASASSLKFFLLLSAHQDVARLLLVSIERGYGQQVKSHLRMDYPSSLWGLIVLVRQSTSESFVFWRAGFWLVFGVLLPFIGLIAPLGLCTVIAKDFSWLRIIGTFLVEIGLLAPATVAYYRFLRMQLEELKVLERRIAAEKQIAAPAVPS